MLVHLLRLLPAFLGNLVSEGPRLSNLAFTRFVSL